MRLIGIGLICLGLISGLRAQDSDVAKTLKESSVELKIEARSFFTDMAVRALVTFPEPKTSEPIDLPELGGEVSVINIEMGASTAAITFRPLKTGLVTIPSFEFRSETTLYRTQPKQILVSTPQASDAMSFAIVPAKTKVYSGEPLRFDVTWTVNLVSDQIRSLQCFPDFFSRQDAKIVIPRCTAPEDQQIGLPFGGRRIAAHREIPDETKSAKFGTVTFPLFVRFESPGLIEIPATRLEIAHLTTTGSSLAPYAVFFNNGLFDPLTSLEAFDRLYVESSPVSIEVVALPEAGRTENFSGLFAPCSITTSLKESVFEVGEVIEVALRVRSKAPHGMLDLPELGIQRSLRGRFRAGAEYGRTWYEDGTGFLGRIRALTTDVTSLPSLQFQVFDPETAQYRFIQTEATPIEVKPSNGQHFFDVRKLAPETTLSNQPNGVWHNAEPGGMGDLMNTAIGFLAENMWLLLCLGPIAFAILLPQVKERRRRANDPQYRTQAAAYEAFRKLPEHGEAKWAAFRNFLAASSAMAGSAWTPGDAAKRLGDIGVSRDDVDQVTRLHNQMDTADFSSQKTSTDLPELNELAKRLFDCFRKAIPAIVLSGILLLPGLAIASEWEEAETLFAKALQAPSGEPATESLFTQSALKFEAAAGEMFRPGASWFNAGNAWFKAGEIGRSISCYRQARIYRPFDSAVVDSLSAARALSVDIVEDSGRFQISTVPVRWLAAAVVLVSWLLVAVLLCHLRYRTSFSFAGGIIALVALLVLICLTLFATHQSEKEGVVVVASIYGRKGPAYSYDRSFNEPLHDGVEFRILEKRENWLLVALADHRKCWIPSDQIRKIKNRRR